MIKYRLLFEKTGRAAFISHLDLMRTLMRAFRRAGVELRRSEGFNPHPIVSIALPLSVGQESLCEIMDFETAQPPDLPSLPGRLNAVLPEGIRALSAYIAGRKHAQIQWIAVEGTLYYGDKLSGITSASELYKIDTPTITKKTKRGETKLDLARCTRDINMRISGDGRSITLNALVSAREPTVNPALLTQIMSRAPEHAAFRRVEIYDGEMNIFR